MKIPVMNRFLIILLIAMNFSAFGQFPELAPSPPMGWNSWNAFGLEINSKIVMDVADSMVAKGMADAGYEYIVIDDGWQIARDTNGKIMVDTSRFPEGIKFLSDYVHARGLKFGIYTCCGTKTCGGRPGSYGYETIDANTYAEWEVDFIKEDWCYTDGLDTRTQYTIMSDAIKASGRPMLLSICEWGVSSPWEWAEGIGTMWRTTTDIQDCFDCIRDWGGMGWVHILDKNANLAPFAGPGHWNDPDMLEVGNYGLNLTECQSHFSMWCMLAAPLMAGNDISTMNDSIRDILTAPEIIAIDQDPLGLQGVRIRKDGGLQVWLKPLNDGACAIALLNLTDETATMKISLEEIGFRKGTSSSIRDLWKQNDLPDILDSYSTKVIPHGVVVLKIKGEKAPVSSLRFSEVTIEINKGNHRLIQLSVLPLHTSLHVCSSDERVVSLLQTGVNQYRLTAEGQGQCELTAKTANDALTASCTVNVIPSSLPSPWKFYDIRDNKSSAVFAKGVFTIEGGGSDIWETHDQFAFLSIPVSGNQYISARIISQTSPHPWAKTGLMIRESTAANSRFVMICMTPGNGISLQWRSSTGGSAMKKDFTATALPFYFKLAKKDTTFSAYRSSDGNTWDLLDEITLEQTFDDQYLIGMEVLSHSSHLLNISKFDKVEVLPIKEYSVK